MNFQFLNPKIKISVLTATLVFLACSKLVFAVDSSSSADATPAAAPAPQVEQKAQDILDKVATKVAQIAKKEERTYHGTIKSLDKSSFALTTSEGDQSVTVNDATNFFRIRAGKQADADFKDLKVGDDLVALGVIDPQTEEMTASEVIAKIHRANLVGTIGSVDASGVVSFTDSSGKQFKADLTSAITLEKVSGGKIGTAKVADFTAGNYIFVIGYSPDAKTGVYSVLKTLTISK